MFNVLAWVLLTTSIEPDASIYDLVSYDLAQICLTVEILDYRELIYILRNSSEFVRDMKMLQTRYRLSKDIPHLNQINHFNISRDDTNVQLVINRLYRNHIEYNLAVIYQGHDELKGIIKEIDFLYQIWDTYRDAQCTSYYVNIRRNAINRLYELIGPELFYCGQLPPVIPLWRLEPR